MYGHGFISIRTFRIGVFFDLLCTLGDLRDLLVKVWIQLGIDPQLFRPSFSPFLIKGFLLIFRTGKRTADSGRATHQGTHGSSVDHLMDAFLGEYLLAFTPAFYTSLHSLLGAFTCTSHNAATSTTDRSTFKAINTVGSDLLTKAAF